LEGREISISFFCGTGENAENEWKRVKSFTLFMIIFCSCKLIPLISPRKRERNDADTYSFLPICLATAGRKAICGGGR
jgi:hypothetical protein